MLLTRSHLSRALIYFGIIAIFLLTTSLAISQIVTQSDETVDVKSTLTDMGFFAAKDLKIEVQSEDDIFAAGQDITISNTKADHLIVAGGDITMSGINLKDLIIAGGSVDLVQGRLRDDLVAAAGDLDIEPEFTLAGSAMLAGETLSINTPIGGDLRAAAETLSLNANVAGNAQLYGEDIVVGPNVRIEGNLRYRSDEFKMDPTAVIVGTVTKLEDDDRPDEFEKWGSKAAAVIAVFALAFTIGVVILVCASTAVFPGLMNSASAMIREKPLVTVGIGFLIVFTGPVLLGLLFASVLGIPLALLIGAFYLVAAPLAFAVSAYFLGMRGREMIRKEKDDTPDLRARILWPLMAVLALFIVGLIPLIGVLIWFIAYVFGMGAVVVRGGKALASTT